MRRWWLLGLCLWLGACAPDKPVFHNANGQVQQLPQDKWIIINYWASWCTPCKREVGELNAFYQHYQNSNVVLFGVNFDNLHGRELQDEVRKLKIQYPVLQENPQQFFRLADVEVLPATFIINPSGKVVKTIVGATSEQDLLNYFKSM